ncbi:uncharacterized protein N7469_004531 [Penicillium citrinum]|uniref:Protein-lysine N-methyltransferase EFM4 n=2 Tax=Penicillium TaxID=5073 RepID=A0A9W9P7A8_PENCI|nr:uncharacterized protein N7469_004531 [Penicillium citrinum]KAJ5235363.1 hypothetical protein N7469_004531 [Penicillium citrinum]KAJ5590992.1 hypothetical protein N7450_004964 [Penicillium hetheringtonii]
MAEEGPPTYLSPSELGTKDYWETYYARTLAHISNPTEPPENEPDNSDADSVNDEDDPGTSWFSEHNAPEKVLRFLTRSSFPLSPRATRGQIVQPSVLDLGTGNGSMLALLRKKGGFTGDFVGVDYSAQSIWLARELQRTRGHSAYHTDSDEDDSEEDGEVSSETTNAGELPEIRFEEWDILGSKAILSPFGKEVSPAETDEMLSWFPYSRGGFDIVLDKGTFDAISLAEDAKETRVCERYPDIVRRLIRAGGFLMVTSCNWTEEELVHWFTAAQGSDRFIVWGRVEYPRFRFGGQEGQGVCTVCFQRVVS